MLKKWLDFPKMARFSRLSYFMKPPPKASEEGLLEGLKNATAPLAYILPCIHDDFKLLQIYRREESREERVREREREYIR